MLLLARPIATAMPIQTLNASVNTDEFVRPAQANQGETLNECLRRELVKQAHSCCPMTYGQLAMAAGISSMSETKVLGDTLQQLMEEDVRKDRPLLAALAISGHGNGLPAPWFFRKAKDLGKFSGQPKDIEAFAFHASELRRALFHYTRTGALATWPSPALTDTPSGTSMAVRPR